MIKNYLKIAWRNLKGNKFFSAINVLGLAIGMAVAILIGLWIYDELSYNKYYKNYDHIAQVIQHQTFNGEVNTLMALPMPLGAELKANYKEYFTHIVMAWWTLDHLLSTEDKKITQFGTFMEPEGPEMLSLHMLKGGYSSLDDPHSILLSSSVAKAFFGDDDPFNKMMKIDNRIDVKVTGVYEDIPANCEFSNVKFISAWQLWIAYNDWMKNSKDNWGNNSFLTYVEIKPGYRFEDISKKIQHIKQSKLNAEQAKANPQVFLQPMRNWHLQAEFKNGKNTGGKIQFVWMFGIIGVFILLLACINFMNLSTARSEKRAREVGIRKTLGSQRQQLVKQFLSESFLVVLIAYGLAFVIVVVSLPVFNEVAGKKMNIPFSNIYFWLFGLGFIFVTAIVSGSYPALYLSSFNPLSVLKGTFRTPRFASLPRKVLVVLQFTVSIALIIGTIVVFRQVQLARNRPIGYSRDGLVMMQVNTSDYSGKFDLLHDELLSTGAITEMAESSGPTFNVTANNSGFDWKGKDPSLQEDFATIWVTHDYGKTVQWEFLQGRDFSRQFATDSTAIVLNETAVKFMGLKDPLNETVRWNNQPLHVIGVIKDMIMESAYEPAKQTIFFLTSSDISWINMRINPRLSVAQALTKIENVFKKIIPAVPFDYKFADQEYALKFAAEQRIGKLARIFAFLAIFISCLGVLGLASFVAERRTKEIGIRKILGASIFNIWRMLSKDFVVLVTISCFVAVPVAYYFMDQWLQKYEYRTQINWWIFAIAIGGSLIITLLTISFQAIKAAISNPVKSLRTE